MLLPNTPLFTRREFIQTLTVAGLAASLPAFLTNSVAAQAAAVGGDGMRDDRILVVIQLGGGNDGLNCVVPYADDNYHRARPGIGLKPQSVLRLDDQAGLNQGMQAFKELFDNGELAVIQGVGYPNPNRSHFRSMEIWHTATDSERYATTGWIGRYFDNCCAGAPTPVAGVNIGREAPQAFGGKLGLGVSFEQPQNFGWASGGLRSTRAAFDQLNRTGAHHDEEKTIDFLRHKTANAVLSSDKVLRAGSTKRQIVDYPNSRLSNQLKTIATLIAGGLPTRIYYTSLTGFDTHANQQGQHANLLKQFAEGTAAFMKDLKAIGAEDRVQVMAFSEFGRRVGENASRGTDHGTAGPMFMLGNRIVPGMHGKAPDLVDLDEGDLKHGMDFRSVYSEVLTKWLGAPADKVLEKSFPHMGLVRA